MGNCSVYQAYAETKGQIIIADNSFNFVFIPHTQLHKPT